MKNNSELKKWLLIALFILWFFFIVGSFFVVHKPFSPLVVAQLATINWQPIGFQLSAIVDVLFNLLFALWFLFVATGVGALLWQWLMKTAVSPTTLEHLIFSAGIGAGLIGLLVLLLGLLGLLGNVALSLFAIGLTVVALAGFQHLPKRFNGKRPSRPIKLYLTIALFFTITLAFLPPTNWDGLFYHLKGPKLYLEAGRIYGGINIPHLSFPSLFQMNFLLAMGLRSDIAAQLIHLLFVPLLAGLVYAMATRILGLDDGWVAVLLLITMPMVLILAPVSYNDLALAFYSVGALYAFLRWQQTEARPWIILAGLFAGFAMSLKYTSFMTPLFIGLALLWEIRHQWRKRLPEVLLYGGTAWLVALPWYIKNFFFTGNPFYPFVFDGLYWDSYRSAAYSEAGTGLGWDIVALLRLPYDMTLAIQDASQDGLAGPFFLGFLPLLLFYVFTRVGKRPLRPMRLILLYVLANYIVWLFGVVSSQALWQVRLFLPGLVALCAPIAWAYDAIREWDHPQFSLRNFMNLALGFVLSMLLLSQFWGWLTAQPWAYLTGAESREEYLLRTLGTHYAAMDGLNEMLPEDGVVLFLWEPRSYYCDLDCRPDSILDEWGHLVYLHNRAPDIAQALRADGVTHLLIWRTGLDFVIETNRGDIQTDVVVLNELLTSEVSSIEFETELGYELFELLIESQHNP